MSRKRLIFAWTVALILAASQFAFAQVNLNGQVPILGRNIPKYMTALPHFAGARVDASGGVLTINMRELTEQVLPTGYPQTTVWGYEISNGTTTAPAHWPSFTVEAQKNVPVTVTYHNMLGNATLYTPFGGGPGIIPVDRTIMWADPLNQGMQMAPYDGPVPAVPHLHGGFVSPLSDGGPEAWFTPENHPMYSQINGMAWMHGVSNVYTYPNSQESATLWFHDHAMGATRLNVYAGLAAFYFLRDGWDTGLPGNGPGFPTGAQEIELAIQDRMFDTNGQLFFPDAGINPTLHPFWQPEFFGDVMCVNGVSWPYLRVEPRRYRFHVLDGCNARFLELYLNTNLPIYQVGTEGALLDHPVRIDRSTLANAPVKKLLIAPGERVDIIIDFTGQAGKTFTLMNSANAPYPMGTAADPMTTAQIMQFRVDLPLSSTDNTTNMATNPNLRQTSLVKLVDFTTGTPASGVTVDVERQLVLKEVMGPWGPIEVLVNNTGMGAAVSEHPQEGNTELWKIINLTMDAHPMHLHLVQFQLVNRQRFALNRYLRDWQRLFPGGVNPWDNKYYLPGQFMPHYGPPRPYNYYAPIYGGNPDVTPYLSGTARPADANEQGWKDTYKCYPNEVTTFLVRFAPMTMPVSTPKANQYFPFDPSSEVGYVWHCHIVDHEDNEMMRPYQVSLNPLAPLPGVRKDGAAGNADAVATNYQLGSAYPNPFNPSTQIKFSIPEDSQVSLKVYNALGQELQTLADGNFQAGEHSVSWNAHNFQSGLYYYRLQAGGFTATKTMTLLK